MQIPTRCLLISASLFLNVGCAGGLGQWSAISKSHPAKVCVRPQIERGQPRPFVDGVGWVCGIPSKIILWDPRVDNHNVSETTERAIAQYVEDQELTHTKVRINQYAPIDEWRRLNANRSVGWGWRYSLGALTWLEETVLPGRLFGSDHYNPYTDTISIYSDAPAIAIKEGSRARDVSSRRYPGTYMAVNSLPLVSMWHDTVATEYAFEYLREEHDELMEEGYHLLYPAYGAHLGSDLISFTTVPNTLGAVAGAIPGHILGRYEAQRYQPVETARAQSAESDVALEDNDALDE